MNNALLNINRFTKIVTIINIVATPINEFKCDKEKSYFSMIINGFARDMTSTRDSRAKLIKIRYPYLRSLCCCKYTVRIGKRVAIIVGTKKDNMSLYI